MQIIKAGASYFGVVFGAGFILGTARTLWIVPLVGVRIAEVMEAPLMLGVIVIAARWIIRSFALEGHQARQLAVGGLGLGFLVAAEAAVVFWIRHMTATDYIASRDPVAGTVYLVMLGVFAAMLLLVGKG